MEPIVEKNLLTAIYLRESRGGGPTLAEQKEEIQNHLLRIGLKSKVSFYEDADSDRQGYQSLIKFLSLGVHKLLICWSADRLDSVFDDLNETISFLGDLEVKDVRFIALSSAFDTKNLVNPFSEVLRVVEESKSSLKSERTKSSIEVARKAGRVIGRPTRQYEDIQQLRQSGNSIRVIANKLGISTSTVQAALKRDPKDPPLD